MYVLFAFRVPSHNMILWAYHLLLTGRVCSLSFHTHSSHYTKPVGVRPGVELLHRERRPLVSRTDIGTRMRGRRCGWPCDRTLSPSGASRITRVQDALHYSTTSGKAPFHHLSVVTQQQHSFRSCGTRHHTSPFRTPRRASEEI